MYLTFAWRYFKAKKTTNAINVIAWVSMIAIVVITAAFIVLLSVFNGFEGLVKSLYSTFYTDIRIIPANGKILVMDPALTNKIRAVKDIRNFSFVVEEEALLQNADITTPVFIKGVDSNYEQVTGVADKVIRGGFLLGTSDQPAIVLGSGIENALSVETDRNIYPITVYMFRRGININVVDPFQAFAASNIVTSGTFFIQQDLDNKYAITNLDFVKTMMKMGDNEYGSMEISLADPARSEDVKEELQEIVGKNYKVQTRYEQNQSLYSVMTLEKWAIYAVLTLMLIVATFTMVGALTMLVLEKQKDIQVLKAMGAGQSLVQKIFLSEGLLLALIGTASGMLLALLICWAQVTFDLIPIQGGTFLIDHYPVTLQAFDFLVVFITVSVIAFVASWFPSRKAGLQPIELKS